MAMIENCIERMQSGSVHFTFTKKDGTARHAFGTLDLNIIPVSKHPGSNGNPDSPAQAFYDLEKNEWRSFTKSSLVSVED